MLLEQPLGDSSCNLEALWDKDGWADLAVRGNHPKDHDCLWVLCLGHKFDIGWTGWAIFEFDIAAVAAIDDPVQHEMLLITEEEDANMPVLELVEEAQNLV